MMSTGRDGTPTPASQPMSKSVADWYVNQTKGQFQAFLAEDGHWYLYTPKPVELPERMPSVRF